MADLLVAIIEEILHSSRIMQPFTILTSLRNGLNAKNIMFID